METDIKKLTAMRIEGATLKEIGQVFGLSRQRVHQKLRAAHGLVGLQKPQAKRQRQDKRPGITAEIAILETSLKVQRARLDTVRRDGVPWEIEGLQETVTSLEVRLRDATRVNSMRKPVIKPKKRSKE